MTFNLSHLKTKLFLCRKFNIQIPLTMNKTNLGVITLFLSFLLSCSSVTEELVSLKTEAEPRIPVKFEINLSEEILPLSGTKSMPTLTVPEPTSKAGEGESSDTDPNTPDIATDEYYHYLEYIVYKDGSTVPLKRTQFSLQDEETDGITASVVDSLLPGNYHFCFLAHSDEQVTVSGQTATFQKVGDTFHYYKEMDIEEGAKVTEFFTLNRIVGRIELVSTDKVAENLASLQIKVENYPYTIDLTTGTGCSSDSEYTQTDGFTAEQIGLNHQTHSFFSFQPATGEQLLIYLTATDQEGKTTRVREEIESTPTWNHIIRYTGVLYTPEVSDDTFNIEIEKEWNQTIKDTDIGK